MEMTVHAPVHSFMLKYTIDCELNAKKVIIRANYYHTSERDAFIFIVDIHVQFTFSFLLLYCALVRVVHLPTVGM